MLESLALVLFVIWCFLAVQTLANVLAFRSLEKSSGARPTGFASIVIPARNEERSIGRALAAALGQDYPEFEVVVIDDGSTDRTSEEIRKRDGDDRLKSSSARSLEAGWLGKPNALATGAALVRGEWLLFMDADVELHPRALSDAVSAAEASGWDYLTLLPQFERKGFWEKVLIPMIGVAGFVHLPSYLAFVRRVRFAIGGGSFALVRRSAYESIGGHGAIKASVVDDVRLAMELKRAGFRTMARIARDRVRLRMYHGAFEIVEGFSKNAHAAFGDSLWKPTLFLPLALSIDLAPFLWLFQPSSLALGASLALLLSSRALVHLRLGLSLWPVILSPLTSVAFFFIVVRSLWIARAEGVVRWRGRVYPRATTEF